jgi:FkbM family methyltransferase
MILRYFTEKIRFKKDNKINEPIIENQSKEIDELNSLRREYFVKNLTKKSICIDCGAHIGNIVDVFQETGSLVYAFEPNPYIFKILKNRFTEKPNVLCKNKGVWDKNIHSKLYMHEMQRNDLENVVYAESSSIFSSKINVSKNKEGVMVGHIILNPEESEKVENEGQYVGGQE